MTGTVLAITVTKAAKGTVVEVDTGKLPDEVYQEALMLGLKALVNRGTSKVTKSLYSKEAELHAKALEVAASQVDNLYAGKIRVSGGTKTKGTPGAVMTEARRLAKNLVKDEMKRQGVRVSHVDASEITKAANALIEASPDLLKQAAENLAKRAEVAVPIDVKAIKVSPDKVKKAEAAKAKKAEGTKPALSAAKAAKPAKAKAKQAQAKPAEHHASH